MLKWTLATALERVEGTSEAATGAEGPQVKWSVGGGATERTQVVGMLRDQVRTLDGTPEDDGTVLGGAHRMFVNLKSMIVSRDDKAVLEEVKRGETYLMEKFETALNDRNASPETLRVIEQAHSQIASGSSAMQGLGSTTGSY